VEETLGRQRPLSGSALAGHRAEAGRCRYLLGDWRKPDYEGAVPRQGWVFPSVKGSQVRRSRSVWRRVGVVCRCAASEREQARLGLPTVWTEAERERMRGR